jgi:HD-GYP domain-containing protein (c-di-GMP phosphodiesterase class II)
MIDIKGDKKIINIPSLWKLIERFLSVMGPAYIDHCKRTAYLALKLCEEQHIIGTPKMKLVFAAYFHDIGAIGKSDEYLLHNDYDVYHSIDGYLLLKYKSILKSSSKMVLYHHTSFQNKLFDKYYPFGLKIAICDRFDDWFRHDIPFDIVLSNILKYNNKSFSPLDVLALKKVLSHNDVIYDIKSGKYEDVLNEYISSLKFTRSDVNSFIEMLSSLFELYNETTYNHSKSVAVIAYMLALKMNYDYNDAFKMYFAGLIHDLGKIFIPLEIIEKPGKLTPEEYDVMKGHVKYLEKMGDDIIPREILNMALYHHERLDGNGYPYNISSKDLTIPQQILQISDVISALLAKRSYKDEYPYELIKEILDDNIKNNKLNKDIIEAFYKYHEEISNEANEVILNGYIIKEKMLKERKILYKQIIDKKAKFNNLPLSNFVKNK